MVVRDSYVDSFVLILYSSPGNDIRNTTRMSRMVWISNRHLLLYFKCRFVRYQLSTINPFFHFNGIFYLKSRYVNSVSGYVQLGPVALFLVEFLLEVFTLFTTKFGHFFVCLGIYVREVMGQRRKDLIVELDLKSIKQDLKNIIKANVITDVNLTASWNYG